MIIFLLYFKKSKYLAQKHPLPIFYKSELEEHVEKIIPHDKKSYEISLQKKSVPQIPSIRLLTTIYGIAQPNIEISQKNPSYIQDIFASHKQGNYNHLK